uniref:MATE family efflux transporter n=1 Tax=Agathobacter sp. TaxID=2021311 RepID=UPI0040575A88
MPVFGLNNGMVPIVAYNYGARKKDRLMQTYKLSLIYAICIMTAGTIVFEAIPAAYLLSLIGNVNYVWLAFPIAEVMSMLLTFIFLKKVYSKVIKKSNDFSPEMPLLSDKASA